MTPDTDRQAATRERRRALGLVRVEAWVLPASRAEIREIAARDAEIAADAQNQDAP